MLAFSSRWLSAITRFGISAAAVLLLVSGARAATSPEATDVELFDAIKGGQAEVRVIPRDSTVLTLMVKNTTDKPLRLQLPPVLAAAPILAQQPFPNIFQNNNNGLANNNSGGGNQAVGFNPGGNRNNNNGPFNPFMNVPAGREIKVRLACVCLEHGKPDPTTHVAYELRPLSDFSTDRRVATAVASLGEKNADQRVIQLAVWNMVNEKSWDELAAMKTSSLPAFAEPRFNRQELARALQIVEKLDGLKAEASVNATAGSANAPASVSIYATIGK
jgi:hypothetical protein